MFYWDPFTSCYGYGDSSIYLFPNYSIFYSKDFSIPVWELFFMMKLNVGMNVFIKLQWLLALLATKIWFWLLLNLLIQPTLGKLSYIVFYCSHDTVYSSSVEIQGKVQWTCTKRKTIAAELKLKSSLKNINNRKVVKTVLVLGKQLVSGSKWQFRRQIGQKIAESIQEIWILGRKNRNDVCLTGRL